MRKWLPHPGAPRNLWGRPTPPKGQLGIKPGGPGFGIEREELHHIMGAITPVLRASLEGNHSTTIPSNDHVFEEGHASIPRHTRVHRSMLHEWPQPLPYFATQKQLLEPPYSISSFRKRYPPRPQPLPLAACVTKASCFFFFKSWWI